MITNTANHIEHRCESLDKDQAGLGGLMRSPWALSMDSFSEIQAIYAAHARGPKVDFKAVEKRLGFPLATPHQDYQVAPGGVAVIVLEGLFAPKANLLTQVCGATSMQWATGQLKSALTDPAVKAIVLSIDSPGGSVFATPEFAALVFETSQLKPIVAHSDAQMLSAAYWIASAANAVYISGPTVQVGSIGIVASHSYDPESSPGTTEIVAGRYKRIATSLAPLSADGQAYLQDQVNHLYSVFVDAVSRFRGVTPAAVNAGMADGRSFIGQQAVDAGLVDEILPLGKLVNAMGNNPAAFANRRRLVARRVVNPAAPAGAQLPNRAALPPIIPKILTKQDQVISAVAYSKAHGITLVQALKTLGFAT